MTDIVASIKAINPNAEFVMQADDVKQIEWHNGTKPIAEADILTKQKELQTAYNNNEYQRDRAKAYPSIADQLDMIYHAGVGGDKFQATIKAIKDKHPKE